MPQPGPTGVEGTGRAWPDNESTRRAKLAARTARGRAAAHGHTKQPGPTRQRVERGAEAEQIGRAFRQLISSRAIRQQEPPTQRTLMDAE